MGKSFRRKYGKRSARRGRKSKKFMRRKRGASTARRALSLAKRLANHTEETKYFRRGVAMDVANGGAGGKFAVFDTVKDISAADTQMFSSIGAVSENPLGNKYFHRRTHVRWEIHMDNSNNEEETCNFTVAVVSMKRDMDMVVMSTGSYNGAISAHTDLYQGQAYFDPRFLKVHYYKHFTLTMGGVQPGSIGPCTKYGKFVDKRGRMMRRTAIGSTANPVDFQDQLFFVVCTDNSTLDLENPRINYTVVNVIKDTDLTTAG